MKISQVSIVDYSEEEAEVHNNDSKPIKSKSTKLCAKTLLSEGLRSPVLR